MQHSGIAGTLKHGVGAVVGLLVEQQHFKISQLFLLTDGLGQPFRAVFQYALFDD